MENGWIQLKNMDTKFKKGDIVKILYLHPMQIRDLKRNGFEVADVVPIEYEIEDVIIFEHRAINPSYVLRGYINYSQVDGFTDDQLRLIFRPK